MNFTLVNANMKTKLKRIKAKRFSIKKIFASNIDIKHTNTNVIITLFIFNKKNNIILNTLKKLEFFKWKKKDMYNNRKTLSKYNLYLNSIKKKISWLRSRILIARTLNSTSVFNNKNKGIVMGQSFRKYKLILKKQKSNMLKKLSLSIKRKKRLFNLIKLYNIIKILLNNKKYNKNILHKLILNLIDPYSEMRKEYPKLFVSKLLKKIIKKRFLKNLISSLYYNQMFLFNKFKFTYLFLNFKGFGLINIIEKIYNKKVEFNIINLKSIYLNSDMLSESIAIKLTNRKNKLLRILSKALRKVKLPVFHSYLLDEPCNYNTKENVLNSIRYKTISGIRFEASGRLTRRLIASRSIFKVRYIGNIKNIYSSYKYISSPILRGYIKSSLQYTLINSKTPNGSFGLKGWVSSY
jgi:hypothetical protein